MASPGNNPSGENGMKKVPEKTSCVPPEVALAISSLQALDHETLIEVMQSLIAEQARNAAEKAEEERLALEKAEIERLEAIAAAEKVEIERLAEEKAEQERLEAIEAAEKAEIERLAEEKAEQEKIAEQLAAEKAEYDKRVAADKAEKKRIAAEKAEERLAAEKAQQRRVAAEKADLERLIAQKERTDRIESEKLEQAKLAADEAEKRRLAAEKAEEERLAAEDAELERIAEESRIATDLETLMELRVKIEKEKAAAHKELIENIHMMKKKYYNQFPRPFIPSEAYKKPVPCTLYGFDDKGDAYIRFHNPQVEEDYRRMLYEMEIVYSQSDLNEVAVGDDEIKFGEILVADVGEKGKLEYVRVQVLSRRGDKVLVLNIDEQTCHTVNITHVFWMIEHFFGIPIMCVKCRLPDMETFHGTRAIEEASLVCPTKNSFDARNMFVQVQGSNEKKISSAIPQVAIFPTEDFARTKTWSVNTELLNIIENWNKPPLSFESGMVLTNSKVTYALPNGHIWVQIKSGVMDAIIEKLVPLFNLTILPMDIIVMRVKELRGQGRTAFVSFLNDAFFRVQIIAQIHLKEIGEQLTVELIDYGIKEIIHEHELIPYEYFIEGLKAIPPQAFRAILHGAEFDPGLCLSDYQLKNLSENSKLIVEIVDIKTLSEDKDLPCPVVNVYFMPPTFEENEDKLDLFLTKENKFPCIKPRCKYPLAKNMQRDLGRVFDYHFSINRIKGAGECHTMRFQPQHRYEDA